MATLSISDINNIDIVDFLASQGFQPAYVYGYNYWFHSMLPGRIDKTPSFKVNRKRNKWRDFGNGAGSSLLDFCILQYDWTIREAVIKLSQPLSLIENVSQQQPTTPVTSATKLEILQTYPIRSDALILYLWERRIPLRVARTYCVEVQCSFGDRVFYAIGFRTNAGGYELRNKYHKYSVAPKSPTLIAIGSPDIAIFEGFFDMLTFVTLLNCPGKELPDLAVLNGASLFESFLPAMSAYRTKHLFLDNDPTGDKYSGISKSLNALYQDHRPLYKGYKDLNEWACNIGKPMIPCMEKLPISPPKDT